MNGPDHYREGERLLSEASFVRWPGDPRPLHRDGEDMPPDVHAALLGRANAHFAAATTAALALQAALPLIGDDRQVTDWGKAIGANLTTDPVARITSALLLIDEMATDGRIVDGADKLRAALGVKAGDQ